MITVFPDFFLDIILRFSYPKDIFIEKLRKKSQGNIDISNSIVKYGGNATNTSISLGFLGVENNLLVFTNKLGKLLLKIYTRKLPINLYVIDSSLCLTISLEFTDKVMISYPGCLQNLDPETLINKYFKIFESSKYLVFTGWNHIKDSNKIIERLYEIKKGKLYLDIGDPSSRLKDLKVLARYLEKGYVDILSLNEEELRILGKIYGITGEGIIYTSRKLFELFNLEHLDIHTSDFAYTLPEDVIVKSFNISRDNIVVLTGAGDAWNAGNLYGYLNSMLPENRLYFAHLTAMKYITGQIFKTLGI